ncbi:hypothetical protein K1719_032087 [Acacia pycnantha]|nr:hypothetical protein K1719_032087 [Acacia pycnantha]
MFLGERVIPISINRPLNPIGVDLNCLGCAPIKRCRFSSFRRSTPPKLLPDLESPLLRFAAPSCWSCELVSCALAAESCRLDENFRL